MNARKVNNMATADEESTFILPGRVGFLFGHEPSPEMAIMHFVVRRYMTSGNCAVHDSECSRFYPAGVRAVGED
jgi:hypothetical protein